MGKRLTSDQVFTIRARLIANEAYIDIAKTFGVTYACIHNIASGKSYNSYCSRQTEITARHKLGIINNNAMPMGKLSTWKVREIRALLVAWEPTAWIAEEYGISDSTVRNIAQGKVWDKLICPSCTVLAKRYAAGLPSFTPMAVRDLWDMARQEGDALDTKSIAEFYGISEKLITAIAKTNKFSELRHPWVGESL
jgi:predicted transcriptional regulator